MIAALPDQSASAIQLEFAMRAAQLRVDCWCLDGSLNITACPTVDVGVNHGEVIAAANESLSNSKSVSMNRAGHLLAFRNQHGIVVANLASSDASPLNREQLTLILTNYHNDLSRSDQDEQAIEGFNAQLSQSYEEVNLIFRLSKLLTRTNDPVNAVQTMCDELRSILCYGWMSICFDSGNATLAPLRGLTVTSGKLPFGEPELRAGLENIDSESTLKVLEPASHVLAFRAGSEILTKRIQHGPSAIGVFLAGNRLGADPDVSSNEIQLVDATVRFLELFHENGCRFDEQRQQFLGTLHALSATVDAKDPYTHGHSERVGLLASSLAAKLGLDAEPVEKIRIAGLLHDIGKIGVPDAILTKPAKLTDAEFEIIKLHPVLGHQILEKIPSLAYQLPGVLHHHERWDGRGYPRKLSAHDIPLVARLLALADTFDAMSSNRAYRPAMGRVRVLEEIRRSAGTQFDPDLVESFATMDFSEFDRLLEAAMSAKGLSEPAAAREH